MLQEFNVTGNTPARGNTRDVKMEVPLKYLSNFRRTPNMLLIKCEINLILTWSENCVISSATGVIKFTITDTKRYVPIVTSSTQDNANLLEQLRAGFKRRINWNKYQSKVSTGMQNQYLDFLIDASFQGVNIPFALLFENEGDGKVHTEYYLPKVETKDYNATID